MFYGPIAANGKSQILDLICYLLPQEAISCVPPGDFELAEQLPDAAEMFPCMKAKIRKVRDLAKANNGRWVQYAKNAARVRMWQWWGIAFTRIGNMSGSHAKYDMIKYNHAKSGIIMQSRKKSGLGMQSMMKTTVH